MKLPQLLPLVAATFCATTIFSQDYIPLAKNDSKWINSVSRYEFKEGYNQPQVNLINNTAYCIQNEDSVIAGTSYLKVDDCTGNYIGSVRDEKGKVFFVTKGSSTDRLIYDFTVSAGDTVKNVLIKDKKSPLNYNIQSVVVTSVDSVELYGAMRKRINFSNASWVEGIGNTQGFLVGHYANDPYQKYDLQCMSSNNVSLFPAAQGGVCPLPLALNVDVRKVTELIYPEGVNNKFVMEFNRKVDQDEIYIIDQKGKMIQPAMNISAAKVVIDLTSYSTGKYLVLMRNENNLSLGRMVKI